METKLTVRVNGEDLIRLSMSFYGYTEILDFLLSKEKKIKEKDVPFDMRTQYDKFVNYYLERSDNFDEIYWDNTSLIHLAAWYGYTKSVKILIGRGVDVNKKDRIFDTPLIMTCNGENPKIVKFLLDKGANINQRNKKGLSPLVVAACNGLVKTVKILLNRGAKFNNAYNQVHMILQQMPSDDIDYHWMGRYDSSFKLSEHRRNLLEIADLIQIHQKYRELLLFIKLVKMLGDFEFLSLSILFRKFIAKPLLSFAEQYKVVSYVKQTNSVILMRPEKTQQFLDSLVKD